ncbi:MAG: hypothetical protein HY319_19815 [Armatimonadetes bacterium]|nr:hypothetical protein [Armatimonadota bacterium]
MPKGPGEHLLAEAEHLLAEAEHLLAEAEHLLAAVPRLAGEGRPAGEPLPATAEPRPVVVPLKVEAVRWPGVASSTAVPPRILEAGTRPAT